MLLCSIYRSVYACQPKPAACGHHGHANARV